MTTEPAGTGALLAIPRDGRARTRTEPAQLAGLARSTVTQRLDALADQQWIRPTEDAIFSGRGAPWSTSPHSPLPVTKPSVHDHAGTVSHMPRRGKVIWGGTAATAVEARIPPGSATAPAVRAVAAMKPLRPRGDRKRHARTPSAKGEQGGGRAEAAGEREGAERRPVRVGSLGAFFRTLVHDLQPRWLGSEKGAIHMTTGAVANAAWDLAAKRAGRPV
ncbi:hypothetical protein ADK34_17065 [Streptomyces viridochromogenes]|uniref:Uncharacterized protein n=1 Tax=Streptomyces viridochromogenes TaxID=1938 RepID=A0A0L8KIT0_STRVR|nr:hypothetical protein ADK34_17065 [Streptomyces viridochromogenes]